MAAYRTAPTPLPDIDLQELAPADLTAHGFRSDGPQPRSWTAISLRYRADQRGFVRCLRCTIDADEVDRLVAFPPGARCPVSPTPPADWPWGPADDRLAVPTWWQPATAGVRWRLYEEVTNDVTRGIFAVYAPTTRQLHVWAWTRRDVRLTRPVSSVPVADAIAATLADAAQRAAWTFTADGWYARQGSPLDLDLPRAALPASCTGLEVAFLPRAGQHRYLLRLSGLDRATAEAVLADQPLCPLADNAALPEWAFAAPTAGLPAWCAPGPGPRWTHVVSRLSDGASESARWAAYDPQQQALVIWDWAEVDARPASGHP